MKQCTAALTPAMKDVYRIQPMLRFVRLPEELCALHESDRRRLLNQPLRLLPHTHALHNPQRVLLKWLGERVEHAELAALCKELADCDESTWYRKRTSLNFSGFDLFSCSIDVM